MRRTKQMRRLAGGLVWGLVLMALVLVPAVPTSAQGVFRIGVLAEEDSPLANGVRLAVSLINEAGGVTGANGAVFELDTQVQPPVGDAADLTTAIEALRSTGVIAVVGPVTEAAVRENLAALQSLNVPVFTPAQDDTLLNADTTGILFRARAASISEGRALADFLINVRGLRTIATVQLDTASTVGVVGFQTAAGQLGVTPAPTFLFDPATTFDQLVQNIVTADPPVLVAYGPPALSAELLVALRTAGWFGQFVYNQANTADFRAVAGPALQNGVIAAASWSPASRDAVSQAFTASYVRLYNEVPGALAAAGFDAVELIRAAIGLPGELRENIAMLDNLAGVQGALAPARLPRGEISTNVKLIQLNEFGGATLLARYQGGQRLEDPADVVSPLPALPTATPEGVVATITSQFQNVRTGPGTNFDILGTLPEGTQVQVIGMNPQNTWLVIEFRGQQAWLSAALPDIFGDLNTVPIIQPPPTPTPSVPPTPIPTVPPPAPVEPDLVIETASISPSPVRLGDDFTVTVTIRNLGQTDAGQFAVAATFEPDDEFTSSVIGGLPAGQAITTTLSGELSEGTGTFTVAIVADLNNTVAEGAGEGNNIFNITYTVEEDVIRSGSQRLDDGDTLGLEGDGDPDDVRWEGGDDARLVRLGNARIELLDEDNFNDVTFDDIDPDDINETEIDRDDLDDGDIIGIITDEGNRGVMRVDDVSDDEIDLDFRVYDD